MPWGVGRVSPVPRNTKQSPEGEGAGESPA